MNLTKSFILLLLIALHSAGFAQSPAEYVNPFIGTAGNGHTFPGATVPFGLVQLSPDTDDKGWEYCSGYSYDDSSIMGFSHTHLSGTGRADLCDLLMMPFTGPVKWIAGSKENPDEGYRSRMDKSAEKARQGYYSVPLTDYGILAELTALRRSGMHRYTFNPGSKKGLMIDLVHGVDYTRSADPEKMIDAEFLIENDSTVSGYRISSGWAFMQPVYFVAIFSQKITAHQINCTGKISEEAKVRRGRDLKAALFFENVANDTLQIKVGISTVSVEGARGNLQIEMPGFDFDRTAALSGAEWDKALSKVKIEANDTVKTIFYTALYHSLIAPNRINDTDGSYLGPDLKTHIVDSGDYYSTFSLWDTHRALHPMFTLLYPELVPGMIRSFLLHYQQYGILPMWSLWGNETICMIGNHAIPVITDAYFKKIKGFDVDLAYEAIKESLLREHERSPWGVLDKYGYVPADEQKNSVSVTLEMAFNNSSAALLARALGKEEDAEFFTQRAQSYRMLFDKQTGFMRGKTANGEFTADFDPDKSSYSGDYTEGNARQWTWFAPHDPSGLTELMGGKKKFVSQLDALFNAASAGENIRDVTGLIGQYAHGNEPSHHIPYLYHAAGEQDKGHRIVKRIMTELYSTGTDGLCGNEDCGQLSAWYIMNALGLYALDAGSGNYEFGIPIVEKAEISVLGGTLTILRKGDYYGKLKYVSLNGKRLSGTTVKGVDLRPGSRLEFVMNK